MKKIAAIFLITLSSLSIYSQGEEITKFDTTNFRFGGGVNIGGGYLSVIGDGSDYLGNKASGNLGFVFSYDKVFYDFEMIISNAEAVQSYNNPDYSVNQDSINQIFSFNNTLGYAILDNNILCIYPTLGIAINQLSEIRSNSDKIEGPIKAGFIGGVNVNYKFSSSYGETYLGDFIIGSKISFTQIPDYSGLNISYLNIALYFRFHIRSYKKLY